MAPRPWLPPGPEPGLQPLRAPHRDQLHLSRWKGTLLPAPLLDRMAFPHSCPARFPGWGTVPVKTVTDKEDEGSAVSGFSLRAGSQPPGAERSHMGSHGTIYPAAPIQAAVFFEIPQQRGHLQQMGAQEFRRLVFWPFLLLWQIG